MSLKEKVLNLPPSYREAMNLPLRRDAEVHGRSTPVPVPVSQPFQHDDWAVHASEDQLRAALRDLHQGKAIGTPTRTASPAEMCTGSPALTQRSYSPAPMRSYSPVPPVPLLPALRSFSPAPHVRSFSPAPSTFRSYSPAPVEFDTKVSLGLLSDADAFCPDIYGDEDDFVPPNASFMAVPVRSSSPGPLGSSSPISVHVPRTQSPSPPAIIGQPREGEAFSNPTTGVSPTARHTYPHPSYPPLNQGPPPPQLHSRTTSLSTWEYTTQFARQGHHPPPPRDPREAQREQIRERRGREQREHSGATTSSLSSYGSYSSLSGQMTGGRPRGNSNASLSRPRENSITSVGRAREGSATSQTSSFPHSHSYSSSLSPPISPPVLTYSGTASSPPGVPFTTPITPPSATFSELAGTSPQPIIPFRTTSASVSARPVSPHPPTTGYTLTPAPVEQYDEEPSALMTGPVAAPPKRHFTGGSSVSSTSGNCNGSPHALGRRPPPPRFVSLMLSGSNRIRGVGLPNEVRALVSDSLLQVPKPGIKDFTEIVTGVVEWTIDGSPWQDASEAPRARRILKRILTTLSSAGWHLITSADLSRKDKEKDTLFFREGPPSDREFFAVGFGEMDKMMLVDAPNDGVRIEFLSVVKRWPRGLQDLGEKSNKGCHEVKLAGTPWSGVAADVSSQARLLMLSLLSAMESEGYELVASVNFNKQRKSDTNVDVDSWIFATRA